MDIMCHTYSSQEMIVIGEEGRIQTGSYTNKDGVKVYTSDVVVEHMEFAESKGTSAPDDAAFIDIPEEMIAEMPFR